MGVFCRGGRGDWTDGFLVLVLVLDWTQCLLQGAGAQPAMLRGRMTGFPKNWGPWPPEREDKVDTICTVPIDCGTPTTRMLYPFGASDRVGPLLHNIPSPFLSVMDIFFVDLKFGHIRFYTL